MSVLLCRLLLMVLLELQKVKSSNEPECQLLTCHVMQDSPKESTVKEAVSAILRCMSLAVAGQARQLPAD